MAARTGASTRLPDARRLAIWIAGLTIGAVTLWLLGDVLLLVFAAALLAVGLRGGAERVSGLVGCTPRIGLLLVSLSILLLMAGAAVLGGTHLADQGSQLWDQLGNAVAQVRDWLRQYSWGRSIVAGASPQESAQQGQRLASNLGVAVMGMIGGLASIVIVLVAALYFAATPGDYIGGLVRLLPKRRRRRAHEVLGAVGATLRQWLAAQGLSMLLITAMSYIGLLLLGVPMALLLSLIVGLTNFVPYIGPIAGAIPAVLVAFGAGMQTVLGTVVLFAGIQFIEGNLIQPLLQKRMTRLPPALTILSQTLLGTLFGIGGVILATPVLAVTLVAVRMLYVEDVLGDRAAADD